MDLRSQEKGKRTMTGKQNKILKKNKVSIGELQKFKKGHKRVPKGKGVIYIGRIPHGFYEDQMAEYFSQFGKVISAVVSRSKKTGRSMGYGFVEFEDEDVAKIAAEAMNNYLMFNRVIKCSYIPPEERKKHKIWKYNYKLTCPRVLNRITDVNNKRKAFRNLNTADYLQKTKQKISQFQKFFEDRGINFNFKINTGSERNSDDNDTETTKDEMKNLSNSDIEMDRKYGVLEIDSSDGDINFKTPPQVRKVIKKSSSFSLLSENDSIETNKKLKQKKLIKNKSKETEKASKPRENEKRITRASGEKIEKEDKSPGKIFKNKKSKPLTKKNESLLDQKKAKIREAVENAKKLSKEKNRIKQKSQKVLSRKLTSGIAAGEKKKLTRSKI